MPNTNIQTAFFSSTGYDFVSQREKLRIFFNSLAYCGAPQPKFYEDFIGRERGSEEAVLQCFKAAHDAKFFYLFLYRTSGSPYLQNFGEYGIADCVSDIQRFAEKEHPKLWAYLKKSNKVRPQITWVEFEIYYKKRALANLYSYIGRDVGGFCRKFNMFINKGRFNGSDVHKFLQDSRRFRESNAMSSLGNELSDADIFCRLAWLYLFYRRIMSINCSVCYFSEIDEVFTAIQNHHWPYSMASRSGTFWIKGNEMDRVLKELLPDISGNLIVWNADVGFFNQHYIRLLYDSYAQQFGTIKIVFDHQKFKQFDKNVVRSACTMINKFNNLYFAFDEISNGDNEKSTITVFDAGAVGYQQHIVFYRPWLWSDRLLFNEHYINVSFTYSHFARDWAQMMAARTIDHVGRLDNKFTDSNSFMADIVST